MSVVVGHVTETTELRALLGELEGLPRLGLIGGMRRGWKEYADARWMTLDKIKETCRSLTDEQKLGCKEHSKFDTKITDDFKTFGIVLYEHFDSLQKRDYVLNCCLFYCHSKSVWSNLIGHAT